MKKLFTLFVSLWIAMASLFAANMTGGEVFYLTPHTTWNSDNARYAIYFFNNSTGKNTWTSMTKVEGESNLWTATAPSGTWANLIFCRMNPNVATNDWNASYWGGQTQDLTWDGKNNHFTVDSTKGAWIKPAGKWSNYVVLPVITLGAAPEFATTTVGETSTATVKYTVENSEEKPEISLDNDAFTAVRAGEGIINITFAPTEAKEYTATLTLTIGEVKASVELAAKAVAPEAPKVPEFLNVSAAEFAEIMEGETTSATVTYELLNAEEATATVEGEGFAITAQEVGSVTIEFTAATAGDYTGKLIITSGETVKEVALAATVIAPTPIVTIKVSVPSNWATCYIWAWTATGNLFTEGWPGKAMTKGEDGFYAIDIETAESISLLVSDNGQDSKKTADYTVGVTESTCFVVENNKLVVNEKCEFEVAPEPEPIDPYYAIRGLVSWNMSDDIKLTFDETESQYFIKNLEVDGTASFKIISVDDKGAVCDKCWFASVEEGVEVEVDYTDDGNIILPEGKYDIYFKTLTTTIWINEVKDPVPPTPDPEEPKIIITSELPEFPVTVIGETSEAIITYKVENIDADVSVSIQGEGFSGEDVDGTITIIFTPTEEKVYTGAVTITAGEVSQDVVLFAQAVTEEEPDPDNTITFTVKVPEGTKECWIAGTSDDEDLAWTFIQMEKAVDAAEDNIYTLTTDKLNGKEWKYSSSNEWKYSEIIDGGGNRSEAGVPYDVVTAWQALYDPDFEPIDPYYAIRGLGVTGDAWNAQYEIKLTFNENDENPEWYITGLQIKDGQEFKVVYVDEDGVVCSDCWYGTAVVEINPDLGDDIGPDNIVLPAGSYDIYFKEAIKSMWIQPSTEGPSTDAEEAIEDLIYSIDGTIYAPAPFAIIDLVGKDVTKANGSLEGAYIVKTQNSVTKVLVK